MYTERNIFCWIIVTLPSISFPLAQLFSFHFSLAIPQVSHHTNPVFVANKPITARLRFCGQSGHRSSPEHPSGFDPVPVAFGSGARSRASIWATINIWNFLLTWAINTYLQLKLRGGGREETVEWKGFFSARMAWHAVIVNAKINVLNTSRFAKPITTPFFFLFFQYMTMISQYFEIWILQDSFFGFEYFWDVLCFVFLYFSFCFVFKNIN